ncbi:hypothetical protein [Fonticella tunisiensis]|uniref:Uncharacterized protein n=1 Tax=Fonticella tunisiensis TaxID=1096341 RepID=A0A4R7KAZ0_9CLOT|nr:hypothetical protein [Fonticella tunisiensis]TDT50954.1 hypothetical protein EDD71_12350 [Fonticella tunisiensis]
MIDSSKVFEILEKEGFEEVDEIGYKDDIKVFNFFYTFDEAEIEAAKDYANENYDEGEGEDNWYNEFFLPYLTDIAGDNIKDIVDEICEENGLTGEFVLYEIDRDNYEQCEVTLILGEGSKEIDVDRVLNDLEL